MTGGYTMNVRPLAPRLSLLRAALSCAALFAAPLFSACPDGGVDSNPDDFPPPAGTAPGAPCRAAGDPAGPCDQNLGDASFVDMVCLSGTCVVDCAVGGDFLCRDVVAEFLTCSSLAGHVCVRACGPPDHTCPEGFSCAVDDGACLPTGSFPTSPCRPDAADPCSSSVGGVAGADMICVADTCVVGCATGGADLCRQVDPRLTCSAAAGDACVFDCAAGCPAGFSCFASEGACLPTGAFPGSPCAEGPVGTEPTCGAVGGAEMSCADGTCVIPCEAGVAGDAACAAVDAALGCSGAAGACVPLCQEGACPGGMSCFASEERCLPTGAFPGSPCPPGGPCGVLGDADAPVPMACVADTCVVPCEAGAAGDGLCAAVDPALGCSDAAGACVPRCDAGTCPEGFACFASEDRCLPTGAFPGSPCRDDPDAACDQDLRGHPDLDLVCQSGVCLLDCADGGDFVCGRLDPQLGCSAAAGDVCLPRCGADGACDTGLACLASEGVCLPLGSFPGSPCPAVGEPGACATLSGGAAMVCAEPDPSLGPVCLVDCAEGGTGLCQAVSPALSCYPGPSGPDLCLPNGTFPGSLCRGEGAACDQDLQGQSDLDLVCVAGTCQLSCGGGADTLCGVIAAGQGLTPAALTCVDPDAAHAFCAQAGCATGGPACPAHHHCDPAANACLPFLPVHILHTNDLHSHFDGVGPVTSPLVGGYPQLAARIRAAQARADVRGALRLTVDGGDFTMGTLYHLLQGTVEFGFMRYLGYDGAALGNHELDWGPAALATILGRDRGPTPVIHDLVPTVLGCAAGSAGCPALMPVPVLASNLRFDPVSPDDDALEALYDPDGTADTDDAPLARFHVLERAGLRVGLIGLMGRAAAEISPAAAPLTFDDPIETTRDLVAELRAPPHDVDLVVVLSHSGSAPPPFRDEDEALAEAVPDIDVIVSGHTHDLVPAKRVGHAWIVQAGSYGRTVGELQLAWPLSPWAVGAGRVDADLVRHALEPVSPSGPADPVLTAARSQYRAQIDALFAGSGLAYDTVLGAISGPLVVASGADSSLGALVTDASRFRVNAAVAGTSDTRAIDVAFEANGVIRDDLLTHPALSPTPFTFADLFAVEPLGASPTDTSAPGYPMVEFYVNGAGLRAALEVAATLYPLRGDDFWLHVSGLRWMHDPEGPPFSRVRGIWLDPTGAADVCSASANLLDASGAVKSPSATYRVATNLYVAGFLAQLEGLTGGALSIIARDAAGAPVDPTARVVSDGDGGQLRQWQVLVAYASGRAAANGGLLPAPSGGRVLTVGQHASACAQ